MLKRERGAVVGFWSGDGVRHADADCTRRCKCGGTKDRCLLSVNGGDLGLNYTRCLFDRGDKKMDSFGTMYLNLRANNRRG